MLSKKHDLKFSTHITLPIGDNIILNNTECILRNRSLNTQNWGTTAQWLD